jgi:hypothetical protein
LVHTLRYAWQRKDLEMAARRRQIAEVVMQYWE